MAYRTDERRIDVMAALRRVRMAGALLRATDRETYKARVRAFLEQVTAPEGATV